MRRKVQAADGRQWTVHSRISWTRPERMAPFEHDMAAGSVHGVAMAGLLIVLTLFVVLWAPPGLVMPPWFMLLILLLLLLLPVGWALQRPWIITAYTDEPMATGREHWEGIVLGIISAREEAYHIAEELKARSRPGDGNRVLSQVTPTT